MDYKKSGVDISSLDKIKKRMGKAVKGTFTDNVVTEYGHFGGGFRLTGYKKPVLVSSTDSVGTKVKVAQMAGIYNTVGADIVNHGINDIMCTGASPLFILDYLAYSKLEPENVARIVEGFAKACKKEGVVLIGGETAQLPGLYKPDDFDLVGTVVGAIEEGKLITGAGIKPGDAVIGLPSNGLHTNGYSLARKVLIEGRKSPGLNAKVPGTKKTVAKALLAIHKSYAKEITATRRYLKGIVHITGGGFEGNISRVIPSDTDCVIQLESWKPLPIFRMIAEQGNVPQSEMYKVFNMGMGMIHITRSTHAEEVVSLTRGKLIGRIEKGKGRVHLE